MSCMVIFLYFVVAYFIGSIMSGYIVCYLFGAVDLRQVGSGNVGARNAGRILGKTAFVLTFIGDAFKGFSVVFVPMFFFEINSTLTLIGLGIAVLGHMKPIYLGFQGGKGVATFLGGMAAYDYRVLLMIAFCFLLIYVFSRRFTLSGLGAISLVSLFFYGFNHSWPPCFLVLGITVSIVYAHKENLRRK